MERRQRSALAYLLLALAFRRLAPFLLPHGSAVDIPLEHRPVGAPVDPAKRTSLALDGGKLTKIYERVEEGQTPLITGPETVVFDDNGLMYIMNDDAALVSLTDFEAEDDTPGVLTAKATEMAHLGIGRPLGGKFDGRGCLYFADAVLGLARICLPSSPDSPKPNVELLASRVKLEDGTWSPIVYADDLDIGPKTGHIYFSDASDVPTDKHEGKWDVLYSSKVECVRGTRSGRLLRYKPETGEVDVLVTGLAFANGVAVDKDETFVLCTSTYEAAVIKFHLAGPNAGTAKRMLDGFPGFLDGADCAKVDGGKCYVAIPSTVAPLVNFIFSLDGWAGRIVRNLLMAMPRTWTPPPEHYGAVAEVDPGRGGAPASILRVFEDAEGRDVEMITGVTVHGGKVYLGSLHNDFVGLVALDE
ncbi:hypothetical protein ACHAXT_011000 [Thalassiosira profunda]